MIVSRRGRARAFTLVELLVVIGIIAALIGILLPVLSGVSARGRDIKCQSNIRQLTQSIFAYCAEHKGSMPFGFYWDPSINDANPDPYHASNTWQPKNGTTTFVSWASQVGRYMVRKASGDNDNENFPPVLQCPEAAQARNHVVGYVMNFIVGVTPMNELGAGSPPRAQLKPPNQALMTKETALFWDTAIRPGWENNVGHLTGADIDDQRFWQGATTPQKRYFMAGDPYGATPPGAFGQNKPVILNVGTNVFRNKDPNTSTLERFPYQGNLRFRHNKNTMCNVGFADGSVRQFTAKLNRDGQRVQSHDALRRYFMTKWPSGVPADPNEPGG
jgi:prepilin-type processing-associated H-X9-DG protein